MSKIKWLVSFLLCGGLSACSVEPEPLNYGQDACYTCKMTLMDKKFGAEVVTKKGRIYKFDDANCMVNFLNSGSLEEREVKHRLIVDYSVPEKLIMAENAFYIKSDNVKSPMASQIAAFEEKESMDTYNREWRGIYLTWGELVANFK